MGGKNAGVTAADPQPVRACAAVLDSVVLSKQADAIIVLKMRPVPASPEVIYHWVDNKDVSNVCICDLTLPLLY